MSRAVRRVPDIDDFQNAKITVLEQEIPPPNSSPGKILRSAADGSQFELNAELADLHDVSTTTPTSGQLLKYNSGWAPSNVELADLHNVSGTPSLGQALMYSSSGWVPATIPISGVSGMNLPSLGGIGSGFGFSFNTATQLFDAAQPQLANLAEVALPAVNTIADNAPLVFNATTSKFEPGTTSGGGGAVKEYICEVPTGQSITTAYGDTVTLDNVNSTQTFNSGNSSTTYSAIDGSSITYRPPAGCSKVIYQFDYMVGYLNSQSCLLVQMKKDGTVVTLQKIDECSDSTNTSRATARFVFDASGWTTAQELVLEARTFYTRVATVHYSHFTKHQYSSETYSKPVLTVIAI